MGVVYKARDTRLQRIVALKFLHTDLNISDETKRRFILEAQAASALDHPNVCTVFDIGESEDGRARGADGQRGAVGPGRSVSLLVNDQPIEGNIIPFPPKGVTSIDVKVILE